MISSNLTRLKIENLTHLDHTQKDSTITELNSYSAASDGQSVAALDQAIDIFINNNDQDSCDETYEAVKSLIEKETKKTVLVDEKNRLDDFHKQKLDQIIDIFTDGLE